MEVPNEVGPGKQPEVQQEGANPLATAEKAYARLWLDDYPYTNFMMFRHLLERAELRFEDFFGVKGQTMSLRKVASAIPRVKAVLEDVTKGYAGVPELWNQKHGICSSFCILLADQLLQGGLINDDARNLSFFSNQHRLAAFVPNRKINIDEYKKGDVPDEVIILDSGCENAFLINGKGPATLYLNKAGKKVEYKFSHVWAKAEGGTVRCILQQSEISNITYPAYVYQVIVGFQLKWAQAMNSCLRELCNQTNIICMFRSVHSDGRLGFEGKMTWNFVPLPNGQNVTFSIFREVPGDQTNKVQLWGYKVEFGNGGDLDSEKKALNFFSDFHALEGTRGKQVGIAQMPENGELYQTHMAMWSAASTIWGPGRAIWQGPKELEPKVLPSIEEIK